MGTASPICCPELSPRGHLLLSCPTPVPPPYLVYSASEICLHPSPSVYLLGSYCSPQWVSTQRVECSKYRCDHLTPLPPCVNPSESCLDPSLGPQALSLPHLFLPRFLLSSSGHKAQLVASWMCCAVSSIGDSPHHLTAYSLPEVGSYFLSVLPETSPPQEAFLIPCPRLKWQSLTGQQGEAAWGWAGGWVRVPGGPLPMYPQLFVMLASHGHPMLSWQQRVQQAGSRGVPQLLRLLRPDSGQSAQVSGAGKGQFPQVVQAVRLESHASSIMNLLCNLGPVS